MLRQRRRRRQRRRGGLKRRRHRRWRLPDARWRRFTAVAKLGARPRRHSFRRVAFGVGFQRHRYPHELVVAVAVPYEQFDAVRHVATCLVVDLGATVRGRVPRQVHRCRPSWRSCYGACRPTAEIDVDGGWEVTVSVSSCSTWRRLDGDQVLLVRISGAIDVRHPATWRAASVDEVAERSVNEDLCIKLPFTSSMSYTADASNMAVFCLTIMYTR